jgi:hypothetical protein
VFSHIIVGYYISDSLELLGALIALKKALYKTDVSELIHHSDGGVQYLAINILVNCLDGILKLV